MGGCCSYPNGRITAIPALLSIVTTVLSTRAWYSCDYFQVDVQRPYQNETLKTCGVGLFWAECSTYNNAEELTSLKENCVINPFSCSGHASNEVCSPYPQRLHQAMDPSFKTARAFGVIAGTLGFIMMVVTWIFAPCVLVARRGWKYIGAVFLFIGCLQILTLLALSSDFTLNFNSPTLSMGGIQAIVAAILWWIGGAVCFVVPDPKDPYNNEQPASRPPILPVSVEIPAAVVKQTKTQCVEEDGSTTIEAVTIQK